MTATVSVVATVFNESTSIARLLDSLAGQTRHPDEIVITDGGSNDGTLDILKRCAQQGSLSLSVYACPGSNIAQGRNKAIQAARGEIIAVTDAGVNLEPNWLEELVRPFDLDPGIQVVSGFFLPDPHTPFEIAMAATVLPQLADIDPKTFLPSSRSIAFRKTAWQEVGGYPEWLDYCEDLILDLDLRERYGTFAFAPQALVRFRPRSDFRSFFVQYYRYARGDGKADLWRKRHAVRYFTYIVAVPVLFLLTWCHNPWWLLGLVGGAGLYTAMPYRRLRTLIGDLPLHQRLYTIAIVPLIRVAGDIAKMLGYPAGWAWRFRHRQAIPR